MQSDTKPVGTIVRFTETQSLGLSLGPSDILDPISSSTKIFALGVIKGWESVLYSVGKGGRTWYQPKDVINTGLADEPYEKAKVEYDFYKSLPMEAYHIINRIHDRTLKRDGLSFDPVFREFLKSEYYLAALGEYLDDMLEWTIYIGRTEARKNLLKQLEGKTDDRSLGTAKRLEWLLSK